LRQERASYQKLISILVLLLMVALTSFVVAGCSGGSEEGKESKAVDGKAESKDGHEDESDDPLKRDRPLEREAVTEPALMYTQNCGACHGHDGSGVVGPSIRGTALKIEQIQKVIEEGRGQMPKFKGTELKDAHIATIAEYVKNELK